MVRSSPVSDKIITGLVNFTVENFLDQSVRVHFFDVDAAIHLAQDYRLYGTSVASFELGVSEAVCAHQ